MSKMDLSKPITKTLTSSSDTLRSLNIGTGVTKQSAFRAGEVTVVGFRKKPDHDENLEELLEEGHAIGPVTGTLSSQGQLTGMAKIRAGLRLTSGSDYEFVVDGPTSSIWVWPTEDSFEVSESPNTDNFFARNGLNHVHLDPFRPQNLGTWKPENETDVYVVFGALQEFLDYEYCAAASTSLLRRLGAADYFAEKAKPDAVLINKVDGSYALAEWKMNSSDYCSNHDPEDVDVLVCWVDDEADSLLLPPNIVELRRVASAAADEALAAAFED